MEEKQGLWSRLADFRVVRFFASSIRNKLLLAFLALSVPALIILGIIGYGVASSALSEQAINALRSVEASRVVTLNKVFTRLRRDIQDLGDTASKTRNETYNKNQAITQLKARALLDVMRTWEADVVDVASDPDIVNATPAFTAAFRNQGATRVRGLYLGKAALEDAADGGEYSKVHNAQHSFFSGYTKIHGYLDAFLLDSSGNVVYSALKDDAFGTNVTTGAYKDSGLATLYQQLKAAPSGKAYIADLALYGKDWVMFIGAPVYDGNRQVGILAYRVSSASINAIIQDRAGMSSTAETYAIAPVGNKLLYRSDRVVKQGKIGGEHAASKEIESALAGKIATEVKVGSTSAYEVSVGVPYQFLNLKWALVTSQSLAEGLSPIASGQQKDHYTLLADRYGYYDVFLIGEDGYIFYTVQHEPDYQTNILTGPYKDTNLGKLIAQVFKTKTLAFSDFAPYAPSNNAPAAFAAAPLLDASGNVDLVLAVQLPLKEINDTMQERTGLGSSGEAYLVGQDKLWRSDSRFLKDLNTTTTVLNPQFKVDTVGSQNALAGKPGNAVYPDYRGIPVLGVWSLVDVEAPSANNPQGVRWALLAEIDEAEVFTPVRTLAATTAFVVIVTIILVITVAFVLSRALVTQINAIMRLFSQIGIGEFSARTPVLSTDELGTMATSLNAMLDNTLTLIQSREQRESMQSAIMTLLDEVSGVAAGDLSKEATVTAEMTGAIADAFNYMIAQLRQIISRVQDTTLQVSSAAGEIQTTAEHLAQGSETQAQQIVDTSAALEEMAVSIQQVSDNAVLSNTVAEQALNNAKRGTQAVQETMSAMNRIRDQVQETSKRIKRLGESSQEISEIVRIIDDIADRTSILALNASIQAAMAGEAGRGFAIVAEEVERLAERSTSATRQIETLVKTIQGETNETVAAMEDSTREVVEGSKLATQAGQALGEIEGVSSRLAELIQSISLASKQQARGAENLSQSMTDISQVTQQTAAGTKQAAVSINNLAVLAEELRASVSTFKLPSVSQN